MTNREIYDKLISGTWECDPVRFDYKPDRISDLMLRMFTRTRRMFRWNGLPDTIPEKNLELMLQMNGFAGIAKAGQDLYAFFGGLGGVPDAYYRPTQLTVSNPALKLNRVFEIGKNCVIISNDSLRMGLTGLNAKYASMITETELSTYVALINSRIPSLISASDDRTVRSAEEYIKKIRNGELAVIAEQAFLDGLKTHPYSGTTATGDLTNLIEMEQYWKASWWNELGLNANYNMKRESLNSAESQLNDDALLPLVDDMLTCRQEACEQINAMFGTEISVQLASAWEDNQEELNAEQDQISADAEQTPEETEQTPEDDLGTEARND